MKETPGSIRKTGIMLAILVQACATERGVSSTKVTDIPVNPTSPLVKATGSYPQFEGTDSAFNQAITSTVLSALATHEKNAAEFIDARKATAKTAAESAQANVVDTTGMGFVVRSTITRNDAQYASVVIRWGGYSGGAHGYEKIATFTFDRAAKRRIGIQDLVTQAQLDSIAKDVKTKIVSQLVSRGQQPGDSGARWVEEGAGPKLENYSRFTIGSDTTITFYFEQYQVAPYVFGEQAITVPFRAAKGT